MACVFRDSQGRLVYWDDHLACITVDYRDPVTGQQPCYGPGDVFSDDSGNQVDYATVYSCFFPTVYNPPPPPAEPPDLSGIQAALDALTAAVGAVSGDVAAVGSEVSHQLTGAVTVIGDDVSIIGHTITNAISGATTTITTAISGIAGPITTAIGQAVTSITSSTNAARDTVTKAITDTTATVGREVDKVGSETLAAIGATTATLAGDIHQIGADLTASIAGAVATITTDINDVGTAITAAITDTLNSILPGLLDTLSANTAALVSFVQGLQSSLASPADVLTDVQAWLGANWPNVYPHLSDLLQVVIGPSIKGGLEAIESEAAGATEGVITDILNKGQWPDPIKGILSGLQHPTHQFQLIGLLVLVGKICDAAINAYIEPWAEHERQAGLSDSRPTLPTMDDMLTAERRDIGDFEDTNHVGALTGLSQTWIDMLRQVHTDRLTPLDYVRLYWRNNLDRVTLDQRLRGVNFDSGATEDLLAAEKFYPPATDLIRFLTRDVFIPEFVSRFGMDQEYPAAADAAMLTQGIDHETALNYWLAHWELPSLTQAFTMYHRVFDTPLGDSGDPVTLQDGSTVYRGLARTDLARLQRAQGVEPFWRDRQLAITFNPLTRVDIRRMHKTGVLQDGDLERQYLNLGYDQTNAQRLAEFTIKLNKLEVSADLEPWRAGIRGHVTSGYEKGVLNASETTRVLGELGYTDTQIAAFITEAETVRAITLADAVRAAAKTLYVRTLESDAAVAQALKGFGFDDDEITDLFSVWSVERLARELTDAEKAHKELSKSEVITAYKDHIIDNTTAHDHLAALHFTDDEIHLLLATADYQRTAADTASILQGIQAQYVAGRIDDTQAHQQLDQLSIDAGRKQALFNKWQIERTHKAQAVPLSHLERLVNQGLITHDEAMTELVAEGYSTGRATQLLALFGDDLAAQQLAAKQKAESAAATAARRVEAEKQRAAREVKQAHPPLTRPNILKLAVDGEITPEDAHSRLVASGLSDADATLLLNDALGINPNPPAPPTA